MGTASSKRFIRQNAGLLTEEAALLDSDGAADAQRIPALGATGVLHPSILNATQTSAGAGSAGRIVQLDGAGRIDGTMMPSGIGAEQASIQASEAISVGDYVNIHSVTGQPRVRRADAATPGREAHAFAVTAATSGTNCTIQFEGANGGVTGQTPGPVFLSDTTAGRGQATAPTAAGRIVQRIGFASSGVSVSFNAGEPIQLA